MGYRSDVRIITTKDGFEKMMNYINEELSKKENENYDNPLNKLDAKEETTNLIMFGWDWIKYDSLNLSYKLVQDSLKKLEESNISYSICINGEEIGDVERYRFDSEKDKEIKIPVPSIGCKFDDKETKKDLEFAEKELQEYIEETNYEV